jgi:adenylyltransferase/sulfurtransferase
VNSSIAIEALVTDVHSGNVEALAGLEHGGRRVDLILDGTDNVETRYLINDVAVKHGLPWVYGACVGTEGRVMTVRPGTTACLRCVFPNAPAGSELPTCDTAGVLGPAAHVVASLQVASALRLLCGSANGNDETAPASLLTLDVWHGRFHALDTGDPVPDCPACGRRQFDFLDRPSDGTTSLCGRRSVQVRPANGAAGFDMNAVQAKLSNAGNVQRTPYLLRCRLNDPEGLDLTLFTDGRLIVTGTTDEARAKSIYARFVGS